VAGTIGVSLLGLGALFLPSWQPGARSDAFSGKTAQPWPSDRIGSPSASVSLRFLTNVLAASAAPGTHSLQALAGIPDIDSHKAFGSKTAPVIMEVFSDYQCPACKTLFLGTNRQLMENYVSTGKVFLIHRDFPLPAHAHSRVAARYARAAAQIGKIEPVEEALFQNQEKWEQTGDVDGTVAAALSPAEMAKVRALVKGGTLEPMIDKDYALGQVYRVNQTPTTIFHCKGQTYPYASVMSYDILKQFLEQLLTQK
jgi:protein-disulfide isomerase